MIKKPSHFLEILKQFKIYWNLHTYSKKILKIAIQTVVNKTNENILRYIHLGSRAHIHIKMYRTIIELLGFCVEYDF